MNDLLERELREALADRAALIPREATARLRAVDYRPRSHWLPSRSRSHRLPSRPLQGALGLGGAAAVAGAAIVLASSAAPAFAGWTASPTAPQPGQVAAAEQQCDAGAGAPALSDTRGPYTASIFADGSTCLSGNGITINSSGTGDPNASIPAGTIELGGAGESDSAGNALTMVDGRIGTGVTSVTITRSDGSSVQATVKNGWYLAWWPGTQRAVTAKVATANGTNTQSFPPARNAPTAPCPTGAHCNVGYGFGSAQTHGSRLSTMSTTGHASR